MVRQTGSAQITSPPKQIPYVAHWLILTSALELCTELGDVYNWWLEWGYGMTSRFPGVPYTIQHNSYRWEESRFSLAQVKNRVTKAIHQKCSEWKEEANESSR